MVSEMYILPGGSIDLAIFFSTAAEHVHSYVNSNMIIDCQRYSAGFLSVHREQGRIPVHMIVHVITR